MTLFFISCAVILIVFLSWGFYFFKQNGKRHSAQEVLKILSLGTLSIIPVLIFHQWLLDKVVVKLKILWPFLNGLFISTLLELSLLLIFIIFFIGIFAVLHAMSLKLFYHLPWKNSFKTIYSRLYNLSPILIFFVLFLLLEGVYNAFNGETFILSLAGSTIVFAVLEEYFKYIINPFLVYKKINSIRTAMIHAIYVGLVFALIENILFFYAHLGSIDFFNLVAYRSVFTTILHIGASGILGYFYGMSLFSETMLANYEIEKGTYRLPFWLKGFLQKTVAFSSLSITQGFFLAALFHALFNLLLYLDMIWLAALLATALMASVIALVHSKFVKVRYGLIGSSTMSLEDFEKLRLQISVLEHVKEIQKARLQISE